MAICLKYIDTTYMIRAIPSNASDNVYCTLLAQSVVHGAMAGHTGFIVAPVNGTHAYIPFHHLISSFVDKTVHLWKVGHDQCLKAFAHSNYVTCVQFNHVDDNQFISGSIDGKVHIWAIDGCQIVDLTDLRDLVTAVSYRPDGKVVIYNGLLQLTFTKPGGHIIGLQYNGLDNLLKLHNPELNGGFWDLNWSDPESTQTRGKFNMINGTIFEIIVQNEEQVELSFKRPWDSSLKDEHSPLYIDKRFIMLSGSSGLYSYAIYEHGADMPPFSFNEARLVFMLNIEKFRYVAMADNRQRYMPLPYDRLLGRGQELAYPEAILLVNPMEPEFIGGSIDAGTLTYKPPRDGPTLWEIGTPDRSPAEFFVPEPDPKYINKLYVNHPDRKAGSDMYTGTTWQIKFKLGNVDHTGIYKLRLALA